MPQAVQEKPRRTQGRMPLPPEEALVGYGLHLRPNSLRDLREVAAFTGGAIREVVENHTAHAKARIAKDPLYTEWVAAGRPVPISDWVAAGKPRDWPKHLEMK